MKNLKKILALVIGALIIGGCFVVGAYAYGDTSTKFVSYNPNGGQGETQTFPVDYGTEHTIISTTPNNTPNTFLGWATSKSSKTPKYYAGQKITVKSNISLYAVYEIAQFELKFDTLGGSAVSSQTGNNVYKIRSTKPSKNGYKFLGWASVSTATEPEYMPGDTIKILSDKTLYAVWEKIIYTLTYNGNGYTGGSLPEPESTGMVYTAKGANIVKEIDEYEKYDFVGWAQSPEKTSASYKEGSTIKLSADKTIYAVWKLRTYTLSFDANGGTGGPRASSNKPSYKISSSKPSLKGFEFLGWAKSPTATQPDYQPKEEIRIGCDTTLYAVYRPYVLDYDANGGTGAPNSESGQYEYAITDVVPTREGYTFLGWSTKPDAKSASYKAGKVFKIKSDTTFYAVWKYTTYKLTYDKNGGSGSAPRQSNDAHYTIADFAPTKRGYKFIGWSTEKDGAVEYVAGDNIVLTENTTIYAVWRLNNFTLTYDPNGGNPLSNNKTTGNYQYTITSAIPEREHYQFLGWAPEADATRAKYIAGGKITITEPTTLYAVWKHMNYKISYDLNGGYGCSLSPKTSNYIYTVATVTPKKDGYEFCGWKSSTDKQIYDGGTSIEINEDCLLSAVWEKVSYTITYDGNDNNDDVGGKASKVPQSQTLPAGQVTSIITNAAPERAGCKFSGWATSPRGAAVYQKGDAIHLTGDTTLYAVWKYGYYQLSFNMGAATGVENASVFTTRTGAFSYVIPTEKPRVKYEKDSVNNMWFKGWSTSASSTIADIKPGDTIVPTSNVTLYAVWDTGLSEKTHVCEVKFKNAITGVTKSGSSTGTNNQFIVPDIESERQGYVFEGWGLYNGETVTKVVYPGDEIGVNTSIMFVALWSKKIYTISYDANGGYGLGTVPSAANNTQRVYVAKEFAELHKDGYSFKGWSTTPQGSVQYKPGDEIEPLNDIILYAVWG